MSNVFRNELEPSYKKATTTDSQTNLFSNKKKLYGTSQLVLRLIDSNANLIYIDEYILSSMNLKPYNWAKKEDKIN